MWMKEFPNVYFGIGPLLLSQWHHPEWEDVVRKMDIKRLLFETDSPYLAANPTHTFKIIERVAAICNLEINKLLCMYQENVKCAFGINL